MKIIDVMQQWNDDCNDSFQMLLVNIFLNNSNTIAAKLKL